MIIYLFETIENLSYDGWIQTCVCCNSCIRYNYYTTYKLICNSLIKNIK